MRRIDDLISTVFGKFELGAFQARSRALESWDTVAGETLAELTKVKGFKKSVVIIEVCHPAASMEIRLRKMELVSSLNDIAGESIFTDIRTVVGGRKNCGRQRHFDR